MYDKIADFMPRVVLAALLGGIGVAGYIFCLGPVWSYNVLYLLRQQATMIEGHAEALMHRRVNKVPAAMAGMAFVQLAAITIVACAACAVSPADAPHLTCSLLLGGFAIWAILGASRDAHALITTVKTSNMMNGCLMIEREVWHEKPSQLSLIANAARIWLRNK